MDTQISEIAERIYRFSTFVPDVGPTGFTFNQYLIDDEQPLLFHTGHRATFPLLAEAIATITPLDRLRWITFGHVEADECGAMNELLAAAPQAEVAHGALGCMVSLNDLADRTPAAAHRRPGHRARPTSCPAHRHAARPPRMGGPGPLRGDHQDTAVRRPLHPTRQRPGDHDRRHCRGRRAGRGCLRGHCLTPNTAPTIRRLADLGPTTLAVMHGSCFSGDGSMALLALADDYDRRLCDVRS